MLEHTLWNWNYFERGFPLQSLGLCVGLNSMAVIFAVVFFLILVIHRTLYKPYNIIRNPVLVGFGHLLDCNPGRKMSPTQMVYDVMKRRTRRSDLPPVFPNGWIPILASNKLHVGQAIAITALGEDLAIFRGFDGKSYVLDAYCPHLGANLGVGGTVKDSSCIQCPFHGWIFDGSNGRCTSIPYSKSVPPSSSNIRAWKTCERTGFIFVWFHAENEPPSWEIPEVKEIVDGRWTEKGTTEHTVFCHVQEIPENGADLAHFANVHSEITLTGNDLRKKAGGFWSPLQHKWYPKWFAGEAPNAHMAFLELNTHISIFGRNLPILDLSLKIKQIGPALVYLFFEKPYLKGAFIQYITPEGPLQHRITHSFFCDWRIPTFVGRLYLYIEAIQIERDIMIWNNKKFIKNPVIVKEDLQISKYRRWYSQFYSTNSPTLQDVEDRRLDW